jgi:hypothetical protein
MYFATLETTNKLISCVGNGATIGKAYSPGPPIADWFDPVTHERTFQYELVFPSGCHYNAGLLAHDYEQNPSGLSRQKVDDNLYKCITTGTVDGSYGQDQQIFLLANGQTYLTAYAEDTINYTWQAPSGSGYTYSSTYTADAPDNCPGGITKPGEVKPWVVNTMQGSTSAQVQQCQAGRTYTITYMVKDSSQKVVRQTSLVVKVDAGQRQPSFLANNQTNLTVYVGDTINYTWQGPKGDGYTYSSTYTADAPDCPGGITKPGEVKPWVANTEQGSTSAQVQQCQAGRTYTITYVAKDSSQKVVYQSSIIVKVAVGLKPTTQYNPLDTSIYTAPTTIPGVTDKNQNIQTQTQIQNQNQTGSNQNSLTNSLSDIISKINSILESAKNLSQEDQDIISKAMQTVINTIKDLIANLTPKISETSKTQTQTKTTPIIASTSTQKTSAKFNVVPAPSDPMNFQYLLTQKQGNDFGWYAFAEIETYDNQGKLRTPISNKVYSDSPYNHPDMTPERAYDRNVYSIWNAGGGPTPGTPSHYTAWIMLDYGSALKNSKIRILDNGWLGQTITLYGSNNGVDFWEITKFSKDTDPLWDSYWNTNFNPDKRRWFEYPLPPYTKFAEDPTASLTVNGAKDITVHPGSDVVILKWNATNADNIELKTTNMFYKQNGVSCVPFTENSFPTSANTIGTRFNGQTAFYPSDCGTGKTITITYTAKQMLTGKTAKDTVTIKILDKPSNAISVVLPNGSYYYRIDYINQIGSPSGSGITKYSDGVNSTSTKINIGRSCVYDYSSGTVGECKYPPLPRLTTESSNPGIKAEIIQQPQVVCSSSFNCGEWAEAYLKVSIDPSVPVGFYVVRVKGDNGQGPVSIDALVTVYDENLCHSWVSSRISDEPVPPSIHILPENAEPGQTTTTWYDPGMMVPDNNPAFGGPGCGSTANRLWQMK